MTGAHPMHENGWTDDRTAQLKKLWREGQSASQIARTLGGGATRASVIGKIHRLGISDRGTPTAPNATAADGALRAPEVKRYLQAGAINARKGRPPRPGQQNRPAVVFGEGATVLNAEETELKRQAAQAVGEKVKAGFMEPANDTAIPLMRRGRYQCAWPVGEPARSAEQMCCGGRVLDGGNPSTESYCSRHVTRAVARVLVGGAPDAKKYERSLRRFAAA